MEHDEVIDIHGKAFTVSNEIFAKEYAPYANVDDAFINKNTKDIYTAEFLGDKVKLVLVSHSIAMDKLMKDLIPFRNRLIDELGFDKKLKW